MRMILAMLLALSSGCCAERALITNDWTRCPVPVPVDDNEIYLPPSTPSRVASMCREYIDQCWEWNVDLSLSNQNKPVVICNVADNVVLQPRKVRLDNIQELPIPCGGVIEFKETSLCDAIANVCDNYGLRCSFENHSVIIALPNGVQGDEK